MEEDINKINNENSDSIEVEEVKKDDYVMKLPESEKKEEAKLEPNKTPMWSMRIAAGLIDLSLIFLMTFGLFQLFIRTPLANGLKKYGNGMIDIQNTYKLQELVPPTTETYGHKLYENEEEYNESKYKDYLIYHDEEVGLDYKVVNNTEISKELIAAYKQALAADKTYNSYSFNYRLINYGLMMFAIGVSEAVLLLIVPLLNKRRGSIGNLFAGTQLINSKYYCRAKWYQITGRFLWIFLIETAFPYLFIEGYTIFVVPILTYILSLFNKDRRLIHDYVSRTKLIDKRTFTPLDEQ